MSAIDNAKQVNDIGFDVYASKLIGTTFDALISANIRQTESHLELVKSVSGSLKDFIENTHDSISDAEIVNILQAVLPGKEVKEGSPLTKDEITKLNGAVEIKELGAGDAGAEQTGTGKGKNAEGSPAAGPDKNLIKPNNTVAVQEGNLSGAGADAIYNAVAKRLSANRYDLLQNMVKAGMLRLVVDNGEILTRMSFNTYENTSNTLVRQSSSNVSGGVGVKTGTLAKIFGVCGKMNTTAISCSTAKSSHSDNSGTTVDIFGQVRLNFHTDYQPLNK